jgi:glycosyltransferase involved in cell wall biosynthesis
VKGWLLHIIEADHQGVQGGYKVKPLVTVITPAYNCEKYIVDTIYSVLDQEYPYLEYYVIEDDSTDNTWQVLCNHVYADYFKRKRHRRNKGEQATVNDGLSLVRGKYFMIVNADDPLKRMAVPTLVDVMEAHRNVLCAYPDWQLIDEKGRYGVHVTSQEYDFRRMVSHPTCLPPSVGSMLRSDIIKLVGYRDTSFHWLGDFDYWLRIGLVGDMARVPHELAFWRYHAVQESAKKSLARAEEHIRLMNKFFKGFN